jgi:hypothetical protein
MKIYYRFFSLFFAVSCAFISISALASGLPYKIDERAAQKLAAVANEGSEKFWKQYDYDENMDAIFYSYNELGLNVDSLGFFAVNPWTGDVWNIMQCKRISSPAARAMQNKIRKRFTATEMEQYQKLSALMPCTPDPG